MLPEEPLRMLRRSDKWYLGGGNRLIWAPPFPVWLDYPGFWDKAHYYNFDVEPVFTWTLLDDEGREIPVRFPERHWTPASITASARIPLPPERAGIMLEVTEERSCLPGDVLASAVRLTNRGRKPVIVNLVAWTAHLHEPAGHGPIIDNVRTGTGMVRFSSALVRGSAPRLRAGCCFSMPGSTVDGQVRCSERSALQPHWRLTPFAERFRSGGITAGPGIGDIPQDGYVWMALHTRLRIPAGAERRITITFGMAPEVRGAVKAVHSVKKAHSLATGAAAWRDYFSSVPEFFCSDPWLQNYYYYRWYGLRLLTMHGRELHYTHPSVCEGIGYFRAPISYSAMCHMVENRWLPDPALAQGSLLTFIRNQRKDGGFRGYIDPHYYRQEMFYHSNWGRALTALQDIHPDRSFLRRAYEGLSRYARYFDRERDAERSGLYDIDNHYETGQEYMHRYVAVNPRADREHWGEVFRLKGVDVTVYIYELKNALADAAAMLRLGSSEVRRWRDGAERIRAAVLDTMWDDEEGMFFDIDPATGRRTGVKAAVCFYPYMTDIVTPRQLPGLKRHLLGAEFMTPYPVPSSSVNDRYFSAVPEWKGKRMNCPWNGRVWPMTNSHIAEVLATAAVRFSDDELRNETALFIGRFVRMMFFDGDPGRPNCFEHYNPFSGEPSVYRGVDDYQHSWVNDLLIRYCAGIRPERGRVAFDPFPFDCEKAGVANVVIRGKHYAIARNGGRIRVSVDGVSRVFHTGESLILAG